METLRSLHLWQDGVKSDKQLHWADASAVVYLVIPVFIFFAFFIRVEIAIPACTLIAFLLYEIVRRTAWRTAWPPGWEPLYFLALASLWVWLSGGLGPVYPNSDWDKHYKIINFLTQHSWPATDNLQNYGPSALRYYIGWYLVPALALKIAHVDNPTFAMFAWSTLGVFLFFNLLRSIVGKRSAVAAAPLIFIAFGGADLIGTRFSEFSDPYELQYYLDWWAGWVQFSSNTTALFWVPQHAISAWLGVAILMRCRHQDMLLPYCALLAATVFLWSPFSAIGLIPFLLALTMQYGFGKILLNWRVAASIFLIAAPVGLYLISGSAEVPRGYIGTLPCGWSTWCFTWSSYLLFLVLEIGAVMAILLLHKERKQGFLLAAAASLCLIPLYKVGFVNDFGMRVSLPSLAVLAILFAKLFVIGPRPYRTAILLTLLAAMPTVASEVSRGLLRTDHIRPDSVLDPAAAGSVNRRWIVQYFAPLPIWVLRPVE